MGSKKSRNRSLMVASSRGTLVGDGAIRVTSDGSLQVNLARVQPPQNVYDADFCWPERRMGTVSLFFAKAFPGVAAQRLRTRVELRYPYGPFVRHFWANSRGFHERLRAYLAEHPFEIESVNIRPAEMEAEREHSDWVNFDYLAHTASEAALDFFHVPPAGIAKFAQSHDRSGLTLTPVLRVHTTAAQLCSLLDACEPIAQEIETHFPPGEASNE